MSLIFALGEQGYGQALKIEIYAPGTIIGKALASLETGSGVIDVLVTLQ